MKRFALFGAVAVGISSFVFILRYQKAFEARVSGGARVGVLVALSNIKLGDVLMEDKLVVREIPSLYVEDRQVRALDVAQAIGIRTTMALKAGEAIMWTDLAVASEDRRALSALVENGMRAVTVAASGRAKLGGLLRPGDRIDLLFTVNRQSGAEVVPLLQNILVLAVGREMGLETKLVAMMQSTSDLTVSVTAAQAQALTLAQSEGTLTASLRNPDDIVVSRDRPTTTALDIFTAKKRAELQSDSRSPPVKKITESIREIENVQ